VGKFSDAQWKRVASQLRGRSLDWWERHNDQIVELGDVEIRDMISALGSRGSHAAQVEIVARMDPMQWQTYRDGNTYRLSGIARRRAEMLDGLSELGWMLARVLGRAIGRALLD
jgi:hypothetical protein